MPDFPKTVRVYSEIAGGFVDKKVRHRTVDLIGQTYRSWAIPMGDVVEYLNPENGLITKRVTSRFTLHTENG